MGTHCDAKFSQHFLYLHMEHQYVYPSDNKDSSDAKEFDFLLKRKGIIPVWNQYLEPVCKNQVYSQLLTFYFQTYQVNISKIM